MTVDTLEYVKKLEAAGVERRQAEAHAQAIRDTLAPQFATKADLDATAVRLEAKIDNLAARIDAKVAELKAEMIKYMIAQGFAVAGVVIAAVRLMR